MTTYARSSRALAYGLAALAGYVDAVGFLASGGFFASFMSGNTTRLAVALGEGRRSAALALAGVLACFVGGAMAGSLLALRAGTRRKPAVLRLVAGLLAVAAFGFARASPVLGVGATAVAMGAENAVFQRGGEVSIGLTYVTGALVRLGQRLATALVRKGAPWAWTPYAGLWLGLLVGAVLGTCAHRTLGAAALWAAAAYALAMSAIAARVPVAVG